MVSSLKCIDRKSRPYIILLTFRVAGLLALRPNQVAHWWHLGRVTGERQAAELPATLDGGKHGVVAIGHVGGARRVVRVRDGQRNYMTTAGIGVAAAARVAEPKRS